MKFIFKSTSKIKRPGARGGKYWIDKKGDVQYGERPTGRKAKPKENKAAKRQAIDPSEYKKHGIPEDAKHAYAYDKHDKYTHEWRDSKGRLQRRYQQQFVDQKQGEKYKRITNAIHRLPELREAVNNDINGSNMVKKYTALAVRIIDLTGGRVGNEKYTESNDTHGITTLLKKHVIFNENSVTLNYIGKKSVEQSHEITDPVVVESLRQLQQLPGERLFEIDAKGNVNSDGVNKYLGIYGLTAKDLRTFRANAEFTKQLLNAGNKGEDNERKKVVAEALKFVSEHLGNTPNVCRTNYISPELLNGYLEGKLSRKFALAKSKGDTFELPKVNKKNEPGGKYTPDDYDELFTEDEQNFIEVWSELTPENDKGKRIEPAKDEKGGKIEKSHVKAHTRVTALGKIASVREYSNSKTKIPGATNIKYPLLTSDIEKNQKIILPVFIKEIKSRKSGDDLRRFIMGEPPYFSDGSFWFKLYEANRNNKNVSYDYIVDILPDHFCKFINQEIGSRSKKYMNYDEIYNYYSKKSNNEIKNQIKTKIRLYDQVTIHQKDIGALYGHKSRTLTGKVCQLDKTDKGKPIYCIQYQDEKGNDNRTWVNDKEIVKLHKSIRLLFKSHVSGHFRTTETGKMVLINPYENSKVKKPEEPSQTSLFGSSGEIPKSKANVQEISVNMIVRDEDQPRVDFDQQKLKELGDSIRKIGLMQPIGVRPIENGTHKIIFGERRWRASKLAGLPTIPAQILDVKDKKELYAIQVAENLARQEMNPIETANAYKKLKDVDMSYEEIAERVGVSPLTVQRKLSLTTLIPEISNLIRHGDLAESHGILIGLAGLRSQFQFEVLKKITDSKKKISKDELDGIVSRYKQAQNQTSFFGSPESSNVITGISQINNNKVEAVKRQLAGLLGNVVKAAERIIDNKNYKLAPAILKQQGKLGKTKEELKLLQNYLSTIVKELETADAFFHSGGSVQQYLTKQNVKKETRKKRWVRKSFELFKSIVRQHTKMSASGKLVTVNQYTNKKTKKSPVSSGHPINRSWELPKEDSKNNHNAKIPESLSEKCKQDMPGKGGEIHLSKKEVTTLLKYGIVGFISAGINPNDPDDKKLTEPDIKNREKKLREDLIKKGLKFVKVTGKYGEIEDSYMVMVPNVKDKELVELGKQYNQDSVIYCDHNKNKMIYTTGKNDGQYYPGSGFELLNNSAMDYYTEIDTTGGKVKFSLKFDFGKLLKSVHFLIRGKVFPVGHVSVHKDGTMWKKIKSTGKPEDWKEVTGAAKKKVLARRKEGNIIDFGKKIGGARKDTAQFGYSRNKRTTKKNTLSPWRDKYIVLKRVDGSGWVIGKKGDKYGLATRRDSVYNSEKEAEKAIPLYAVAEKFRVFQDRNEKDRYSILKRITDRKFLKIVDRTFATEEEAKLYMVKHAEELLETKTTFGEEILPAPEIAIRRGTVRRNQDATPEMFMKKFKPRGIEFGNWNNQSERQQVLNHAYDGLLDLADVLGVTPSELMLGGELAIAFGARGAGLSGAKAHYELDYGVINLTKMKGAGALGHEYFHALDHYFARKDSKSPSEKIINDNGDKVFRKTNIDRNFISHGEGYHSQLKPEMIATFKSLMDNIYKKPVKYVEDREKVDIFVNKAREQIKSSIDSIRKDLKSDLTKTYTWRSNTRGLLPASKEQLAEFDKLTKLLIKGKDLKLKYYPSTNSKSRYGSGHFSSDTLESISKIYKDVRGRSGFDNQNRYGCMDELAAAMKIYDGRLQMVNDAKKSTVKTKSVPTSYAIEAKKLDQARVGDYWSEPHEMAARAFAAYIEDKIKGKGNQSDFLVYRAHGEIIVPMIDGFIAIPYPEKEERTTINKEFDKMFKVIRKQKELRKSVFGGE